MVRRRKEHGREVHQDYNDETQSLINPFSPRSERNNKSSEDKIHDEVENKEHYDQPWTNNFNSHVSSLWPTFQPTNTGPNLISQLFDPNISDKSLGTHTQNIRCDVEINSEQEDLISQQLSGRLLNSDKNMDIRRDNQTTISNPDSEFSAHILRNQTAILQQRLHTDTNRLSQSTYRILGQPTGKKSSEALNHLRNKVGSIVDMGSDANSHTDGIEMKVDLTSSSLPFSSPERKEREGDLLGLGSEPIRTSSGLLLTHRKAPTMPYNVSSDLCNSSNSDYGGNDHPTTAKRTDIHSKQKSLLPLTNNQVGIDVSGGVRSNISKSPWIKQPLRGVEGKGVPFDLSSESERDTKIHKYIRSCVYVFTVLFLIGTSAILISSWRRRENGSNGKNVTNSNIQGRRTRSSFNTSEIKLSVNSSAFDSIKYTLNDEQGKITLMQANKLMLGGKSINKLKGKKKEGAIHKNLRELRKEFEEWIDHHSKSYKTEREKESRFRIWIENHHRTLKKNEKHGPCKLTGKPVFGSNHFKDLTIEEFQKTYLTGYKGPRVEKTSSREDTHGRRAQAPPKRADPTKSKDPKVFTPYMHAWSKNLETTMSFSEKTGGYTSSAVTWRNIFSTCKGSMSCYLKYLFGSQYTRVGAYDEDNFPGTVDWRNAGAVTSIHKQGNCGACWGITAVETIESAYFIKSGELLELAETEAILCDDTCEMCGGGWPQNAYEYAMEHDGLPLESSLSYDGDLLYLITMVLAGENDEVDHDYVDSYMESACPAKGGNKNVERYAKPHGYGYATERCLCYTNGQGCDCNNQDEAQALANIASFGPATMCLDASVWMDYDGGIITAESGCSQDFMDMNHCIQVVGYAFLSEGDDDTEEENDDRSGSGSNSRKSGSRDFENREGYFIVRNQWSEYWGMNGYAYVAMGNGYTNTCGSLNDITQVYFD